MESGRRGLILFTPEQRFIIEQAITAYRTAKEHRAALERQINTVVPAAERRNMTMILAAMWRSVDETVPEFVKAEYKNRRLSIVMAQSVN